MNILDVTTTQQETTHVVNAYQLSVLYQAIFSLVGLLRYVLFSIDDNRPIVRGAFFYTMLPTVIIILISIIIVTYIVKKDNDITLKKGITVKTRFGLVIYSMFLFGFSIPDSVLALINSFGHPVEISLVLIVANQILLALFYYIDKARQ